MSEKNQKPIEIPKTAEQCAFAMAVEFARTGAPTSDLTFEWEDPEKMAKYCADVADAIHKRFTP